MHNHLTGSFSSIGLLRRNGQCTHHTTAAAAPPQSMYRSVDGEKAIRALYDQCLSALPFQHEERLVETSFGTAHVVVCGPPDAPPLVMWHGMGLPAPFVLALFHSLIPQFRIYAPDMPYHGTLC